jgi:hypothetical protein
MDMSKANIYAAVVSIVTIYLIILSYVFYYFKDDFVKAFSKKASSTTHVADKPKQS